MHDLIYVFDAYCGWCYGFGPALRELDASQDVTITVISGSLFSGDNAGPIGEFHHIPGANERISALTGVTFGEGYRAVLADGSFVLDSDAAARGLAALKVAAGPGRDLEMAHAIQQAFYIDGHDLSDPATYAMIATAHGLEPDVVRDLVTHPDTATAARAEQRAVADLGVRSYPTLLVDTPQGLAKVGSPVSSAASLRRTLDALG